MEFENGKVLKKILRYWIFEHCKMLKYKIIQLHQCCQEGKIFSKNLLLQNRNFEMALKKEVFESKKKSTSNDIFLLNGNIFRFDSSPLGEPHALYHYFIFNTHTQMIRNVKYKSSFSSVTPMKSNQILQFVKRLLLFLF